MSPSVLLFCGAQMHVLLPDPHLLLHFSNINGKDKFNYWAATDMVLKLKVEHTSVAVIILFKGGVDEVGELYIKLYFEKKKK